MKVLLVNKFLYQKGGSESYVIRLGKKIEEEGHDVQYFGLMDSKNSLNNRYNLYANNIDFSKNTASKILKIKDMINSKDAYRKMEKLLNLYKPDLVILNNIEFHLTPSIIDAYKKYKIKNSDKVKLFYVAHDYQLVCPSHGLFNSNLELCEKCLGGNYWNCFKTKCHKNSRIKSFIATLDSIYWHSKDTYTYVDYFICPSYFMKKKLDTISSFKERTIVIQNFVDKKEIERYTKEDYIIYFGKLCKEKGVDTLIDVAKELPNIRFVFAGYGPSEEKIKNVKNCELLGFKYGNELQELISKARLSICPSECSENCPFSVIESQMNGTPVLGADIGGIPELIDIGKTGEVFKPKDKINLKNKIENLWNNKELLEEYSNNCFQKDIVTLDEYYSKIISLYLEGRKDESI